MLMAAPRGNGTIQLGLTVRPDPTDTKVEVLAEIMLLGLEEALGSLRWTAICELRDKYRITESGPVVESLVGRAFPEVQVAAVLAPAPGLPQKGPTATPKAAGVPVQSSPHGVLSEASRPVVLHGTARPSVDTPPRAQPADFGDVAEDGARGVVAVDKLTVRRSPPPPAAASLPQCNPYFHYEEVEEVASERHGGGRGTSRKRRRVTYTYGKNPAPGGPFAQIEPSQKRPRSGITAQPSLPPLCLLPDQPLPRPLAPIPTTSSRCTEVDLFHG
mmetsp:Transcript_32360/g.90604  ORF Transcript_32360/g.90604 Transcript_32360/m.90604 type:complete len:273 (+) Transcript_32360:597-1415(+)